MRVGDQRQGAAQVADRLALGNLETDQGRIDAVEGDALGDEMPHPVFGQAGTGEIDIDVVER